MKGLTFVLQVVGRSSCKGIGGTGFRRLKEDVVDHFIERLKALNRKPFSAGPAWRGGGVGHA